MLYTKLHIVTNIDKCVMSMYTIRDAYLTLQKGHGIQVHDPLMPLFYQVLGPL